MSTWFFNYQIEPEGEWFPALADSRDKIVKEKQPPFTTILDVDANLSADSTPEDNAKACYRGPFYIDLDSKDAGEVINQYQKLLRKLRNDFDIELDQLHLYATGGRGFHILIPQPIFMSKPNPRGIPHLPLMYKEMANALYVDTLDLNIYSTKRGRMFREPNVKRTNGQYKVPITVQESFEMDEDMYKAITAVPRHLPPPSKPTFSDDLGLLFATSNEKVSEAVKLRKSAAADQSIIEAFGGKVPPTLTAVMEGQYLKEGVGFQKIATQLAIAAHAMGQSHDDFIASCAGLIENHVGDSERYGTAAKRKRELSRMFNYMQGNPCYVFSVGGIKSLLDKEYKPTDLDFGGVEPSEEASEDEMQFSVSQGINVTKHGIFKKVDGVVVRVSALGLANPKQLLDLHTGEVHGYEVDVFIDSKKQKPKTIGMDAFTSRNSFLKFTLSAGSCNIGLTDAQIGALADIMRVRTEKNGQQVFTVRREGLDVINTPEGKIDIVWADQFGVASNLGMNYRLTGSMTDELQFRTDLRQAPALIDTPETREFFTRLFNINNAETVGRIFGFYLSTFISQPIRHLFGKYPYMQVYGPAGSGKSETNKLVANLHYHNIEPVVASALDATKFVYEEMATCSASVPFIVDEYKPREMRKDLYEKLKGILRSNYNGQQIGKGSVQSSTGQGKLTLTRVSNRSPMVVISEAIEAQSALLERCILVPITKDGKRGHKDDFDYCQQRRQILGHLGRICLDKARGINLEVLRDELHGNMVMVRDLLGARADDADRPLYNIAVLLTGLEFGRRIMSEIFGTVFDDAFATLRSAVVVDGEKLIPRVKSEIAKVLDAIAFLSRFEKDERYQLVPNEDYVKWEKFVELKLKNAYTKYTRFKRSTGEEVLFDSYEAFYTAMNGYNGTMNVICSDSPIKDSPTTTVFRISTEVMLKDGVEEFQ